MKVSKEQLKALIKEELEAVMKEVELEEAGKRGGKARIDGLEPDELADKAERAKELKGVKTTETALALGREPKQPKKDRPFGGQEPEKNLSGTAKGARRRSGTNLEEAQPPLPGQGEDGSDDIAFVGRDQPKQGVVGKVKGALGLGQKEPLDQKVIDRAYGEKPSSGKFKSVGNAYGDKNKQDLAVRDRTAFRGKELNITRFNANAMEEGSELEEARSPTAALDSLVGQELPLFGIIVSDRTFKLGDQVFKAVEDPEDGYRSSLRSIVAVPAARNAKRNKFSAEPLATVRVEKLDQQGEEWSTDAFDGYALIDAETGHQWLRVGTAAPDDYYPAFEFDTQTPEGVSSYGSDIEGIKNKEDLKALDIASDEFDVIRKGQIAAARKAGEKVKPVDRNKEIDKLVKEEDKQMEQIAESFRRFTKILND